jgi:hypothetical protein
MFDSAYKAYNNIKLPSTEEPPKSKTAMAGLLSRTQPAPDKMGTKMDDERTRVGRYVAQIRAKREAVKNG